MTDGSAGITASAPIVAVRGEVHRDVDPEIATFSISVDARDRDRDAVLRLLARRQERVRAVLDGYAAAIEKQETGGVHVYPEGKKGSGEKVTAHNGSVSTTVTVADFAALGPLILAVAAEEQVSVSGPWWELRPGSPVYGEARRAAITDAIAQARDCADALGAEVESLELLADARITGQERPYARPALARSNSSGPRDAPLLDLQPQRQEVYAAVDARFRISTPAVLTRAVD